MVPSGLMHGSLCSLEYAHCFAWGSSASNCKLLCSFPSASRACPAPRLSGFGSAVLIPTLQDNETWLSMYTIVCKNNLQEAGPLLQTNKQKAKNAPSHLASSHLYMFQGICGFNSPSPEAEWSLAGCRYMTTVCFLLLRKGFLHIGASYPVLKSNSLTSIFPFLCGWFPQHPFW